MSDIQAFTGTELAALRRGPSLEACMAHRDERSIRYAVSKLSRQGLRVLFGNNWANSFWQTPEEAQIWLDAARADIAARFAQTETCRVDAFECYWHGEATSIAVQEHLQSWKSPTPPLS